MQKINDKKVDIMQKMIYNGSNRILTKYKKGKRYYNER